MTPATLAEALHKLPANAPLIFQTETGPIGAGYHVTEYKLSRTSSIDCGARRADWTEARLQLLDGANGTHMAVGKFLDILDKSMLAMKGLGAAPMQVEFAHQNKGMRTYSLSEPERYLSLDGDDDAPVVVQLSEERAQCKPAAERRTAGTVVGCCGPIVDPSAPSCCA